MKTTGLSLIFLFSIAFSNFQICNGLMVSLFYESLCPDCRVFITEQLYPTFLKLADSIDLDLVPFGNAKASRRNGTWIFECQHGQPECYANKFHACAVNLFVPTKTVHFVTCDVNSNGPASDSNLKQCADASEISWSTLAQCLSSGAADKYLAAMGQRTQNMRPSIDSVPTVLFDGVFKQAWQDDAVEDLFGLVCRMLENRPQHCRDSAPVELEPSVIIV